MNCYLFGCNDTSLLIESNNKELIRDLVDLYGDYYSDISSPMFTIEYFEGEIPKKYQIKDKEDEEKTYNYLTFDDEKNKLIVYFDKYDKSKLNFMQRIMTNSFLIAFQKNGYSIIHGSCISKNGETFIISGNKGAGKTTTLMKMLEYGYDFISNDKIAVKETEYGIITCGIPHSLGIVKEDINKYNIPKEYGKCDGEKIFFRVKDISKMMNTKVLNKGYLNTIIFPKYEQRKNNMEVFDGIDNIKQLGINNILFEDAVSYHKKYLLNLIKDINYVNPIYLNSVEGNIVIQGEETWDSLNNLLKQKVKQKILVNK